MPKHTIPPWGVQKCASCGNVEIETAQYRTGGRVRYYCATCHNFFQEHGRWPDESDYCVKCGNSPRCNHRRVKG